MMESPPRVNNLDKNGGGTRFSKRKLAPQPVNSGYGILISISFVFFIIILLITILFSIYMQFHFKPYLNIHLASKATNL